MTIWMQLATVLVVGLVMMPAGLAIGGRTGLAMSVTGTMLVLLSLFVLLGYPVAATIIGFWVAVG